MKKLILILPVFALVMSSCGGGGCDPATADGAAACLCEFSKDLDSDDKEKAKEAMENFSKKMEEIEKNIEDGKYSENDVEAAAAKIDGCEL